MLRSRESQSDRGETLVEIIVALTLFGVSLLMLVAGIASLISLGRFRQQESAVGSAVRTISEQLNATYSAAYSSPGSTACTNAVASSIVAALNNFNTSGALPAGVKVFLAPAPTVVGGSYASGALTFPPANDCSGATTPSPSLALGTLQVNFTVAAGGIDANTGNEVDPTSSGGTVSGLYVQKVSIILGATRAS